MIYEPDISALAPTLVLTLDYRAVSLECAGTLNVLTRNQFLEAVEALLTGAPTSLTIDVGLMNVADRGGVHALDEAEKAVRQAGSILRWRGLRSDHRKPVPANRAIPPVSWLPPFSSGSAGPGAA